MIIRPNHQENINCGGGYGRSNGGKYAGTKKMVFITCGDIYR
jgi:hypothetical protein